jgi:hypothetical protein
MSDEILSTRLGTMVHTVVLALRNQFGKRLDRETISEITRDLATEMCLGPTAWAFSGKEQPGQLSYDEEKELALCRAHWESVGAGTPFPDLWEGWKACAKARSHE